MMPALTGPFSNMQQLCSTPTRSTNNIMVIACQPTNEQDQRRNRHALPNQLKPTHRTSN